VRRLLVTASVVPSSPILVTLMKEALNSSETSVLTRGTWRNIPEDAILYFIIVLFTNMQNELIFFGHVHRSFCHTVLISGTVIQLTVQFYIGVCYWMLSRIFNFHLYQSVKTPDVYEAEIKRCGLIGIRYKTSPFRYTVLI
jgi:hypothetical protein